MRRINITEYLEETAALFPEKIAAVQENRKITFQELRNLALALAQKINISLKDKKRQVIAVLLPKSLEALIADIGILYSGNIYMNLDTHNPESRLKAILEHTSPCLLLCDQPRLLGISEMTVDLASLSALPDDEKETVLSLRKELIDSDLLCLINTSGSTGIPKAVALSHRGFIDFTEAVRETGLVAENESIGSLSPVIFDIWSFELCMLMAFASKLVCLPESDAAFPARLLAHLREWKITFIFWVPTIMVIIANRKMLDEFQLPDLRMIWFAGEVFPTVKFNYWRSRLPHARFANFYGPIEITLDCLYYIVDRPFADTEPLPAGKPFVNTRVLLLDDNNQNIPASDLVKEGEICVAGSSLAAGYYNDAEKTAQAFVPNPLEKAYPEIIYRTGDIGRWNEYGEIMFAGRKDTMIKHRGYRIELGEIEHMALQAGAGIANCCALYSGEKIILVYESAQKLNERQIAEKLLACLPRYMLPQVYWHVEEMPRNANGKIDRNHLKQTWSQHAGTAE